MLRLKDVAEQPSRSVFGVGSKWLRPRMVRQYLSYARRHVFPALSTEAAEKLRQYYLKLRSEADPDDNTPITTRQLESLTRLAQARAKLDLRETVTADDAEDVIELMGETLQDLCTDEFGVVQLRIY